jgi:hypothetical protein
MSQALTTGLQNLLPVARRQWPSASMLGASIVKTVL